MMLPTAVVGTVLAFKSLDLDVEGIHAERVDSNTWWWGTRRGFG
jgi:hypothetical protein